MHLCAPSAAAGTVVHTGRAQLLPALRTDQMIGGVKDGEGDEQRAREARVVPREGLGRRGPRAGQGKWAYEGEEGGGEDDRGADGEVAFASEAEQGVRCRGPERGSYEEGE